MAWNEPMGRPKAKRPSAYSRAMSSAAWAPPTCSKATSTAARSSSRSTSGQPSPAAPSGSAAAPSKVIRACERVGSTVATGARVTPARSQVDEEQRHGGGAAPSAALAATMAKSATSPSATGSLVPLRRPSRATVVEVARMRRLRALGEREAADGLAQRQAREPPLLLLRGAGEQQRLGGQVDRRRERRGGEAAPQLLGDHAQLEIAEACARRGSPESRCPSTPSRPFPRHSSRS